MGEQRRRIKQRTARAEGEDMYDAEARSAVMSRVRSSNTKLERRVRSLLHRLGYRFRLHRRDLPGTPDIVLPKHKAVVFVHGCFWHRHPGCKRATTPKKNRETWERKFARNVERDRRAHDELTVLGWEIVTVWECELRDEKALAERLATVLPK